MAERELYPDGEQRRRIMDFIMAAGQTLLENGAEVFRVEQTMEIMARSFHLREFHVYVLTNGIFASAGTAEISEVRNVPSRTTHLSRVAAVNALSREIAEGSMSLDEAESRLVLARRIPFPKDWVQLVSGMGGAFSFAMIFGGDLRSAIAAAVAGLAAGVTHAPQGHIESHVAARLGSAAAPRKQQRVGAGQGVQLLQRFKRLAGKRHQVCPALLHSLGGDRPQAGLAVELIPARFAQFAGAYTCEHQQT